jgi:hypothetical protein
VREKRAEAAKVLLVNAPAQSILSISLDTGFRSRSAFYAAFKELTGQSPGDFRDSRISKQSTRAGRFLTDPAYSPAAFAWLIHTPSESVVANAAPTMPASARSAPNLILHGTFRSSHRFG